MHLLIGSSSLAVLMLFFLPGLSLRADLQLSSAKPHSAQAIQRLEEDKEDEKPEPAEDGKDESKDKDKEEDDKSAEATDELSEEDKVDDKDSGKENSTDKSKAKNETDSKKVKDTSKPGKEEETPSEESKKEQPKKEEPKPFKVKAKPLKIEQTLEGVFVASEMHEIALRPESWSRYEVVEAVEHGKEVKKGDVLVRFDDEQINDRLSEETIDQRLSELALMQEEEESPRKEKLLKLAFESAERSYKQLVEDREYYLKTDRPFAERIAKYRYDSSKEDLASQEEELAQLKKMYEADEITEETEKIVLRRQEFEVQTAKLMLELQTANRDYTLNVSLPRNDLYYATAAEGAKLAMEQARTAMELGSTRGKYELEKKRAARTRSLESNAKLLADRDLMELKSPADGTVYYGRCVGGQWLEIGSMMTKLTPYSTIPPNTVLMTIVQQRPLYVLTNVAEKDVPSFSKDLAAQVSPVADDKVELPAKIAKVAAIPGGGKKFEMRLDLDKGDLPEWLVAGMSCSVKVTTYDKKDAIMVPEELVQTDEDDDKIKYVMRLTDDEKPVRREVKLGKSKDKQVEILSGLKEGDEIVKEEKKDEDSKD